MSSPERYDGSDVRIRITSAEGEVVEVPVLFDLDPPDDVDAPGVSFEVAPVELWAFREKLFGG